METEWQTSGFGLQALGIGFGRRESRFLDSAGSSASRLILLRS